MATGEGCDTAAENLPVKSLKTKKRVIAVVPDPAALAKGFKAVKNLSLKSFALRDAVKDALVAAAVATKVVKPRSIPRIMRKPVRQVAKVLADANVSPSKVAQMGIDPEQRSAVLAAIQNARAIAKGSSSAARIVAASAIAAKRPSPAVLAKDAKKVARAGKALVQAEQKRADRSAKAAVAGLAQNSATLKKLAKQALVDAAVAIGAIKTKDITKELKKSLRQVAKVVAARKINPGDILRSSGGKKLPPGSRHSRLGLMNGWKAYGHGYQQPTITTQGPLCSISGLIKRRGMARVLTSLPPRCRPNKRLVFNLNNSMYRGTGRCAMWPGRTGTTG